MGILVAGVAAAAQTPQPFPRGAQPSKPTQAAPQAPTPEAPPAIAAAPAAESGAPAGPQIGLPIHPQAQFITSYDAGRDQRYYLYGSTVSFAEMVAYYKSALKEKGNLVFEQPPTHMFDVGKFREETMAFPPGVTVKDFTWGGSAGYPNPKRGAQPERFPTVVQIVPAPPPAAPKAR